MSETATLETTPRAVPHGQPQPPAGPARGLPVAFDLEVEYGPAEVGGWKPERMGLACAALAPLGGEAVDSPEAMPARVYLKEETLELKAALESAAFVVGWNHVSFDYEVLEGLRARPRGTRDVDLCVALRQVTGRRWSLENVALATLGEEKGAIDSAAIPAAWRNGFREAVIDTCRRHVWLTAEIWRRIAGRYGALRLPTGRVVRRADFARKRARLSY